MGATRKVGTGVYRVVRFNWHFYLIAAVLLASAICILPFTSGWINTAGWILVSIAAVSVLASLVVTFYVYDLSGLYRLDWLSQPLLGQPVDVINIHAGFDETTPLIISRFPDARVKVFDFFDPEKHTEISIRRARSLYPAFPGTVPIVTEHIPLPNTSADLILLIFAAHEIRNEAERIRFFKDCGRVLKNDGHILVVEHLRDLPNALAYNIGCFHFHSARTWIDTFKLAELNVVHTQKINPFVNLYILDKA